MLSAISSKLSGRLRLTLPVLKRVEKMNHRFAPVFDSQAKVAPSRLLVSLVTLSNVIFNCWNDKAQGTLTVSPLPRGLLGAVIPEMLVSVTIEVIG